MRSVGSVGTVPAMDPTPQGPSAVVQCLALAAMALGVLVGATACSHDDEPDSPSATLATAPDTTNSTTAATTTTTTIEDVEAQVEAAYHDSFAAYYDAVMRPDAPNRLTETMTGKSLERATEYLDTLIKDRQESSIGDAGPPTAEIMSVEILGDSAEVRACEVDATILVQGPDRVIVNDAAVSSLVDAEMVLRNGVWLLSDVAVDDTWPDINGCDR